MLVAALGSSGGAVTTIKALDLFGVQHRDAVIAGLQLEKVALQERADAALVRAADECRAQLAPVIANVTALRGQNCELMRATGALRPDANCWGLER